MRNRHSKLEFLSLLGFLVVVFLVLTNGFTARIDAGSKQADVYTAIEPIGQVLSIIQDEYVKEPNIDRLVEGALTGMMNSLDLHSSYITSEAYQRMREETKGEFLGIGVQIRFDEDKNILVYQPIAGSPAAKVGIIANDLITKVDGVSTMGMSLDEVAKRIRGPRDSMVKVTVWRRHDKGEGEQLEFDIKRAPVPLESIKEARLIDKTIGYVRISDFKDNTAKDLEKNVKELLDKGMTSLILDLRWNPGGLLSAPKDVCDLFLPKNTLVTYTQGRKGGRLNATENMKLFTDKAPLLPETFPIIVLANDNTASAGEITTGALQFWARAIFVGEKTYGKGSVQTVIPLAHPAESALRLTTALYYTPAEVTIDGAGIKPDVEVDMSRKDEIALLRQMFDSVKDDAKLTNEQNHGGVTGNEVGEKTVEDTQLKRAVDILNEDSVFANLLAKYHKDPHETQVAAPPDKVLVEGPAKESVEELPLDASEPPDDAPAPEK